MLWIARTDDPPWQGLPEAFGHWHRAYVRYSRWGKKGVWAGLLSSVSDVPGLECLMVDGNIVRAHQHGAAKKNGSRLMRWASLGAAWAPDTRGG